MTPTPPPSDADRSDASIEQQLDDLLVKIETQEPGTLDPSLLPASFVTASDAEDAASAEAVAAPEDASVEAIETSSTEDAVGPEDARTPEPEPETTDEQTAMLAALNDALLNLGDEPADDAPADPPTEVAASGADSATTATNTANTPDAPGDELSEEDRLQQEIAALIDSAPQIDDAAAASTDEATPTDTAGDEISTEDRIAMEIEALLDVGDGPSDEPNDKPSDEPAEAPANTPVDPPPTAAPAETPAPAPTAVDETSIDELDQLLASEIDADDELAGDFHTVDAITAGIVPSPPTPSDAAADPHAATARDVANELDTQPEDFDLEGSFEPVGAGASTNQDKEDPFAALAAIAETAEENERVYQEQLPREPIDWAGKLEQAKQTLLQLCYLVNWPARRFLTTEWRANLGYIALLNLFFGVGVWIYLIIR